MFLDHVDSFGKFLKFCFVQEHFFTLLENGSKHSFCCFLKNTVPCEFPLLKLYNFIYLTLLIFKLTKQFLRKATPLPNCEGGSILNHQIWQKILTSELMLPDSKKFFHALNTYVQHSTCLRFVHKGYWDTK